MRGYLEIHEVRELGATLSAVLDDLLSRPRVALRPAARQWLFLRDSLTELLGGSGRILGDLTRQQATQYRFEVQARLRRFYLEPGRPVSYVFELMDQRRAIRDGLAEESYPSTCGYVLLVSPARPEAQPYGKTRELAEYLIKVVHSAADAELQVYRALPEIDLTPLLPHFLLEGSAYLRIRNVAEGHAKLGRTISVPAFNPSTMRVTMARLVERTTTTATVRTQEYWYLRWWSLSKARYDSIYQETNFQRYYLVCREGRWIVESNFYPQPRSTTPRRRDA